MSFPYIAGFELEFLHSLLLFLSFIGTLAIFRTPRRRWRLRVVSRPISIATRAHVSSLALRRRIRLACDDALQSCAEPPGASQTPVAKVCQQRIKQFCLLKSRSPYSLTSILSVTCIYMCCIMCITFYKSLYNPPC